MNKRSIQYAKMYKQWRQRKFSWIREYIVGRAFFKILERRNRKMTSLELDTIVSEMHKYEKRHGSLFSAFRREK